MRADTVPLGITQHVAHVIESWSSIRVSKQPATRSEGAAGEDRAIGSAMGQDKLLALAQIVNLMGAHHRTSTEHVHADLFLRSGANEPLTTEARGGFVGRISRLGQELDQAPSGAARGVHLVSVVGVDQLQIPPGPNEGDQLGGDREHRVDAY